MIIEKIKLSNWGPYRGEHVLDLSGDIHAVIAEHEGNSERSNWAGKSWFLAAIRFALYGAHPARYEDEWITSGEKEGSVALELTGGVTVERSRKIGSSTSLLLKEKGTKGRRKDAQDRISEIVGLKLEDFDASVFIGQKQTAKLVAARPAELAKIVGEWLQLGLLRKAEEIARGRVVDANAKHKALLEKLTRTENRLEEIGDQVKLVARAKALEEKIVELEQTLAGMKEKAEAMTAWRRRAVEAERFDKVTEQGVKLKAEFDSMIDVDREWVLKERDRVTERMGEIRHQMREYQRLLEEGFTGVCPVVNDSCPSSKWVKGQLNESEPTLPDGIEDDLKKLEEMKVDCRHKLGQAEAKRDVERKLEEMRVEARRLMDSVEYIDEHGEPPSDVSVAEESRKIATEMVTAERELSDVGEMIQESLSLNKEIVELRGNESGISDELALCRAAVAVLSRDGVQRTISTRAVAEIEAGSNWLLQDASVDLSVSASWSREGKGLASRCSSCGHPFPTSLKVKECGNCGEPRGQKVIDGLELVLSDSSGGADDLAGLAFQLSAAAWLRARRGSQWSVLVVDEPFGALDVANSNKLSACLHTAVRTRFGFDQAFVVAHDASIMESMPRTVKILRGATGSKAEVM